MSSLLSLTTTLQFCGQQRLAATASAAPSSTHTNISMAATCTRRLHHRGYHQLLRSSSSSSSRITGFNTCPNTRSSCTRKIAINSSSSSGGSNTVGGEKPTPAKKKKPKRKPPVKIVEDRPETWEESSAGLRVYVGNIPWSLKKVEATEELQQLCESRFGAVRDVDLAQDPQQKLKHKGFGFITFESEESARAALEGLPQISLGERPLKAGPATEGARKREEPRAIRGRDHAKIYVGNLNWQTTPEKLAKIFGAFGTLVDTKIVKDKETGKSLGYGYVTFAHRRDAERCTYRMDRVEIDGNNVKVNSADSY